MFRKTHRYGRTEELLRAERPEASSELVRSVSRRIGVRPTGVPRLALAGAMTAVMLVGLASVGGVSYAANAAAEALTVAKKAFAVDAGKQAIKVDGLTAGGDQYRPGYGWGDRNHNHTGPPGLQRSGGEAAPPLRAQNAGRLAKRVLTTINVTEQATLYVSVVDRQGNKLLLTQSSKRGGSSVGQGVDGPQTKTLRYQMLVPRAIPISLRIPANLLKAGQTYRIRVIAIDPNGNRSILFLPFRG